MDTVVTEVKKICQWNSSIFVKVYIKLWLNLKKKETKLNQNINYWTYLFTFTTPSFVEISYSFCALTCEHKDQPGLIHGCRFFSTYLRTNLMEDIPLCLLKV
jgi:hypothetical protein